MCIFSIVIQRPVGADDAEVAALALGDLVNVALDVAVCVLCRDDVELSRAPIRYIEIFVLAVEDECYRVAVRLLEALQYQDQVLGAF